MLTIAQLAPLKDRDPYLYETLVKIVASVNATSQRAGVDPSTPSPAPSPIASVTVQAANGWFDISIADPSDSRPGLFYFAESDTTPAFSAPRVYFMGASRNLYVQLGNQTLFWRAYSQYIGSQPSAPITFGSPAIAVVGGGSSSGPVPLPSSGSGVFPNRVPRGANGFGVHPGSRIVRQALL
ncbi:MAG: hypothetical protein DMG37_17435 [Acidobacteria bacterium]|nr:MAG: hypothetical protein DMG37_17435 [Acidobacteriota bacterium]